MRDLLQSPAYEGWTIICLIRGKDEEHAWEKLRNNMSYYHLELSESWKRVEIVLGDISKPKFALDQDTWESLCSQVDVIVHNAATVNSVFSYAQLKNSNVIGTQQALLLAFESAKSSLIRFYYVSTIGLLSGSGIRDEAFPTSSQAFQQLSGYGQSKWVAEQLVLKVTSCFIVELVSYLSSL